MLHVLLVVIALIEVGVARADEAAPSTEVQSEYYKASASAIAEFDEGRFAESRALFLRAHELWPSARTWRTLGMTAFELRMYPQAMLELQAALDDARRPLEPEQRAHMEDLLARSRAFVGRYRLHLTPVEATLALDNVPTKLGPEGAILVAVGEHELRVRSPGFRELRMPLRVQGREDEAHDLVLEPIPNDAPPALPRPGSESHWLRSASWTVSSIAAASLITGAVLGGVALAKHEDLDRHCPQKTCEPSYRGDRESLSRIANASTATLVVGGVAAAAATYLWLRDRREHRVRRIIATAPFGVTGSF
jgi:hypothetical protein